MRKLLVMCSLLLLAGCAGRSKSAATVGTPLTPEQNVAYDQGVEFVSSLEGIEGRWRDDWERDLAVRVRSADVIAVITLRTLRTDTDPEQRVTYRLHGTVDRELIGSAKDGEIDLVTRSDDPGFPSVQGNQSRLANGRFVVFAKRGVEGRVHWHLVDASEQSVNATEAKISELARAPQQSSGQRVIVHNN